MANPPANLTERYTDLLCQYVDHPDERKRLEALNLGKRLFQEQLGPDVLLSLHSEALRRCSASRDPNVARRANDILAEATMAFALSYYRLAQEHRGEAERYKRYAHILEQINEDMLLLNQELQDKQEELERLNQQKSDLLNTVSHEIRTPLTALLGYGEFLEEGIYGPLNPEQAEVLHKLIQGGRDLLLLINNLLDMSRMESGRLRLDRQPTEIVPLLEHAIEQVTPQAQKKDIHLELENPPPELHLVWVDPLRIIQVLVNLLGNAVKFTDPGGSVTVAVEPLEHELKVSVRDTGIGISEEQQQRLFQRFSQAENVKRYGGTGLGLAISKELVSMHGGRIGVHSEPGRGATFFFTMPIWSEEDYPEQTPTSGAQ